MSKTKTIEIITCDEVRIKPNGRKTTVIVDDPEVDDMLSGVHKEDLITFIQSEGYKPGDVFEHEDLSEWAVSNGYIKE